MLLNTSLGLSRGFLLSLTVAIVGMSSPIAAAPAAAAPVATPDYQVKLLLSDAAVDSNGQPSRFLTSKFELGKYQGSEESVYIDTSDRFYGNQGWSIRLRHKEGAESYDVTFKKRAELGDNSLSQASVNRALEIARDNNFDSSDDNYDAQVNASYATSTLDFSNKKEAKCIDKDCTLPHGAAAIDIAADLEPGKLQKATNTTLPEIAAITSTTVKQETWRITIDGIKTDLEVSSFGGEHWVEISEEEDSRKDAANKRSQLMAALEGAGLLEHRDAFKTSAVFAAS